MLPQLADIQTDLKHKKKKKKNTYKEQQKHRPEHQMTPQKKDSH